MAQVEYKVIQGSPQIVEIGMNELAVDGWRFLRMGAGDGKVVVVMERERPATGPRGNDIG